MKSEISNPGKGSRIIESILSKKLLVSILFLAAIVIPRISLFESPSFFDEHVYIGGSWIVYQNNLNPFIGFWGYHPPLIFLCAAIGYYLFGYSLIICRIIIAFFAFLTLLFTFLLGEKLYNKRVGFLASLFLCFSPLFFAQSGIFNPAIPFAALTMSTLYFLNIKSKKGYLISASLLVLTKEPAVLIIAAIVIYEFAIYMTNTQNLSKKIVLAQKIKEYVPRLFFLLSPLIFFIIWMCLNKIFLGWFLWPVLTSLFNNVSFSMYNLQDFLRNAFWIQFKYLISIIILLSISLSTFKLKIKQHFLRKEILLFLMFIFFFIFLFTVSAKKGFIPAPRYLLFLDPLFFIFGAAAISCILKGRILKIAVSILIITLFIGSWYRSDFRMTEGANLSYFHSIHTHKNAAKFLENNFRGYSIITFWPIYSEINDTKFGYVKEPFKKVFTVYKDFGIAGLEKFIHSEKLLSGKDKIIFVTCSATGADEEGSKLPNFLREKRAEILASFESGPEKVTIYSL